MSKELMPWAQKVSMDFHTHYDDCSCHLSPPCGSCTHEGNPNNLEETPEAWGELEEVMALEAQQVLAVFIEEITRQYLWEMAHNLVVMP